MSPFSVCCLLCYSANWQHFTLIAYEFQALQYTHISMSLLRLTSLNGRRRQLRSSKGLNHCRNAFQTSYKVKNVKKVAVLFKSSLKAENEKNDVNKIKIGFWVEQCLHALF